MSVWLTGAAVRARVEECEQSLRSPDPCPCPCPCPVIVVIVTVTRSLSPSPQTRKRSRQIPLPQQIRLWRPRRRGQDEMLRDDGVFVQYQHVARLVRR